MPIKFRCTHCQQFLGISRSQAGSLVDCPGCGRSIRVPNLDGTLEPIPGPAINLRDDALANALEQLAALDVATSPGEPSAVPVSQKVEATQVPVVEAPVAVAIAAPVSIPESFPSDPVTFESDRTRPWVEVEEELESLATGAPIATSARQPQTAVTRRDMLVAAATAVVVGPVVWALSSRGQKATSKAADPSVADMPAARPVEQPPAQPSAPEPALTGRITYVTADGESLPDAGARVLLLPEKRPGSTLLSVEGFRANAAAADLQLARESIKLYGGNYVLADAEGKYGADLPSSGTYELLIISRYQSRPAGPLPRDVLEALGKFFERPQLLIGQTAYEYAHIRLTGKEPAVRDQVFARA